MVVEQEERPSQSISVQNNLNINVDSKWWFRAFYINELHEHTCYENRLQTTACMGADCKELAVFTAPYCPQCLRTILHLEIRQTVQVDEKGDRLKMLGLFAYYPGRTRQHNSPIFRASEQDEIVAFISEVATNVKCKNSRYASDMSSNRYGRALEPSGLVQTGGPYEITTKLLKKKRTKMKKTKETKETNDSETEVRYDSGCLRSAGSFANTILYGDKKFNARFIETLIANNYPVLCCIDNDVFHGDEILVDYSDDLSPLEHYTFTKKTEDTRQMSLYKHFVVRSTESEYLNI
jgi:hypothetical protein